MTGQQAACKGIGNGIKRHLDTEFSEEIPYVSSNAHPYKKTVLLEEEARV